MNFSDFTRLRPGWQDPVEDFFDSSAGRTLISFVNKRKEVIGADNIYPPDPFRALTLMSLEEVSVVILGQDPYHGPNQANGLAFSVENGIKLPPSLKNIYKEIADEYGGQVPSSGDLTYLAKQGVLLLNASLTVEKGQPASHSHIGWKILTDNLIRAVAERNRPCVYMLWGSFAQQKRPIIEKNSDPSSYLILQSNHPSPLSARRGPVPFIGCGHFKTANDWLEEKGEKPISWLPQENLTRKIEEKQLNLL